MTLWISIVSVLIYDLLSGRAPKILHLTQQALIFLLSGYQQNLFEEKFLLSS